jgi:predicted DNA-binding protein (MmcQ/YjbR family)
MNIEDFREYCLLKKGVTEAFPFDEDTLVFKVMGKMFALTGLEGDFRINLKCEPDKAIELREQYSCVIPGYHMSKKHWNTIMVEECDDIGLLKKWIDESYELVVSALTKKLKEELKEK